MFDDVEAGPEVGPADAGRGADGAVAGQEGLGPGAGAGAQRGRSLAPPEAPVKRPCTSKLVRSFQRAQHLKIFFVSLMFIRWKMEVLKRFCCFKVIKRYIYI